MMSDLSKFSAYSFLCVLLLIVIIVVLCEKIHFLVIIGKYLRKILKN